MARQEEKNEKLGVGIKADERTEAQQQACVAASATVALLRYICRREQHNEDNQKYRTIRFGYGQDPNNLTEAQQQACVSASATAGAFLRYICRRDLKYKADADKYGWGLPPDQLTDEQQQACVSAFATVGACS